VSVNFASVLSGLRREHGLSQRQAAADLGVSQALLSHYENGLREPRLEFVVRACDYYGVSADYMLGRAGSSREDAEELRGIAESLRSLSERAERLADGQTAAGA